MFYAKIIKLILWSSLPQNFFDLVKSLIFFGSSRYAKILSFLFTTKFNRAWFKGLMWFQIDNTLILYFAYILWFVGNAGKVVWKNVSQVHFRECSNTTNLHDLLPKRRNIKAMGGSRESEMCKVSSVVGSKHFKPTRLHHLTPGFQGWKFELNWDEFGISALTLIIQAAVAVSDLRNSSSQSAQLTVFALC